MILSHPGLVCAVGFNAAAACAAMRAGIAGFAELPYRDNSGEPIVGAAVPGLPPNLKRDDRLLTLLEGALKDGLTSAAFVRTDTIPLLVGLAESGRPGGGDSLAGDLIPRMQKRLNRKFHPDLSCCLARGHTAGFELLKIARELLQDPDVPACIVAGVDSYLNASSLVWLDQHERLKTLDNSDGVIPGEAAAVIAVRRPPVAGVSAEVIGLGFGKETAHVLSEDTLLGLGLTEAARNALMEAKLGFHEIDWRISDVSGEQYGFKELALVEGRLMRVVRKEAQPVWHSADSIGDSGAAAAVVQLVVAEQSIRKGYAPGNKSLCLASSVSGERAAVVVRLAKS